MKKKYYLPVLAAVSFVSCQEKESDNDISADLPFQPNILWLTCEDITPALGCFGDTVSHTPNLDKMASEGIMYTNAYSVAGVCAPSRCGIITGCYPTSIGGHNMRTTGIGEKGQQQLGLPQRYSIVPPAEVKMFSELLRREGYYTTNNKKTDYQFDWPVTGWNDCSDTAHYKRRDPGQPFFAVFNDITTHESRVWRHSGQSFVIEPEDVNVPPYYPDHPTVRRDIARKYMCITDMDHHIGMRLAELEEYGLLDSTIVFFFSDHGGNLPRQKRELYDSGLRVPLIVRYPNKMFAGRVDTMMVSFVDFAPTVLSLAGIDIPDYMQGQAFLGEQKSEQPRKYIFAGRDRMDGELDRIRAARDNRFKYFKNYYPEKPYVQEIEYRKQIAMMRLLYEFEENQMWTGTDSLWWRKTKPEEELYDTWNDPYELNNLAGDPQYADKLKEMRTALTQWQEEFGDLGEIPEKELVKQMWNGGEKPPVTENVSFNFSDGKMTLDCPTEGASIAWSVAEENGKIHWNVYTEPIEMKEGEEILVTAHRIGYEPAENMVVIAR